MLARKAPNGKGETWAVVIAQALLTKARKGDVSAIRELASRVEGKAPQAIDLKVDDCDLVETLQAARKRVIEWEDRKRTKE